MERFGDAIFRSGTIVDGCSFQFYSQYPYAKVRDADWQGASVEPAAFVGLLATGPTGLRGLVVDSADGFEGAAPDLKTLYLSYTNSGDDGNTHAFSPGDLLTISGVDFPVQAVDVLAGGVAFANTDFLVLTPVALVNVATGSFTNGEFVTQPTYGSNLQVTGIDATSFADQGWVALSLTPRDVDLANATLVESMWTLHSGSSIRNSANTATGDVVDLLGSSAAAFPVTDASGRVLAVTVTSGGSGYTRVPTARIRSANNSTGLASLSIQARTYLAKVTVASGVSAVGNGYAFGVGEGIVYQQGVFARVDPQVVVVSKYDTTPSNVSVGFATESSTVNSSADPSLLDNALGSENYLAPGADRLLVTPTLVVTNSTSVGNSTFLPIVSWDEGRPFRQNQDTVYSRIGDAMATQAYDESGNYVLDRFLVSTRSPLVSNLEGNTISVAVDSGTAYIGGRKTKTYGTLVVDVDKGVDLTDTSLRRFSLAYGSWARVKELGGRFQFSTADTVKLYDAAKGFLSNTAAVAVGNVAPVGSQVGTARMRMLAADSGTPGDPSAAYRLYLFDVVMNSGKSFRDVRSVVYGANAGIADVALERDPTTSANVAVLHDAIASSLVFYVGGPLENANQISYRYRSIDSTVTIANSGTLAKSISANPGEQFPYVATLTTADMADLLVIPTGQNLVATVNVAGTGAVNTTVNTITGTTTTFVSDLAAGDWVTVAANGSTSMIRRVVAVTNSTSVQLDSNGAFTASGCAIYRTFPQNAPVPFGTRSGLTGNTNLAGDLLTLNFGMAFNYSGSVAAALVYDVNRNNVSAGAKVADRDRTVMLRLANVAGNTVGPWSLGVSDVVRLKHVYVGNSSVNNTYPDIATEFTIDSGHNTDYTDLAYLVRKPRAPTQLTSSNYLLVYFDALQTSSGGVMDAVSYKGSSVSTIFADESTLLSDLASRISAWEVPVARGPSYEAPLLEAWDFRPVGANTVTPGFSSGDAPVNPSGTLGFGDTANTANDKKFPVPGSVLTANVTYWMGRIDSVSVSRDGTIAVTRGTPGRDQRLWKPPAVYGGRDTLLKINDVVVPPYPTVPDKASFGVQEILDTRTNSTGFNTEWYYTKRSTVLFADNTVDLAQPTGYTMQAIGGLERRISALEYYSSLSALQSDMASKIIPSSVNPTLDRFKFGFFVDPFDDYLSSNTNDPQYAAFVGDGSLWPALFCWYANGHGDALMATPWTDVECANQVYCTNPPPPLPNTPPPPPPPPPPTVYSGTVTVLDYDYAVQVSPYVGVNNPTISTLPVSGWTGALVGCEVSGMKPSTFYDVYWNGTLRNDAVTLPGQGIGSQKDAWGHPQPLHGTQRFSTDANGHGFFALFFADGTMEFYDIIETFFQVQVDYGFTQYQAMGGTETAANFSNVYALGTVHVDPLKSQTYYGYGTYYSYSGAILGGNESGYSFTGAQQINTNLPGWGWVTTGRTPTLKYNTILISAPGSNASTTAPIWTTGASTWKRVQ